MISKLVRFISIAALASLFLMPSAAIAMSGRDRTESAPTPRPTKTETEEAESTPEPRKSNADTAEALHKVEEAKKEAKSRLEELKSKVESKTEDARRKSCEERKANIANRLGNYIDVATKHKQVFDDILARVNAFAVDNNLEVTNGGSLYAAATTAADNVATQIIALTGLNQIGRAHV